MGNDWDKMWKKWKPKTNITIYRGSSGLYFLGFIGAAIYYLQRATDFWSGLLGLLMALFWPAFLVYKLLGL